MTAWERDADSKPSPLSTWLQVMAGIALVPFLHVCAATVLGGLALLGEATGAPGQSLSELAAALGMMWFMSIGCTQGAYVMPVFIVALLVRRGVAVGVAMGAALTFLLNGACYGVFCGLYANAI